MKIRLLIVDDSVVVRSRISKLLATVPEIEIAGIAANGRIALAKIPLVNPDVIILDVEMPEMDGLETLAAIRTTYPKLPVIMFSTFTVSGATATLDALALGANDYATKPTNLGSIEAANQHILNDLVPKIKIFNAKSPLLTTPLSGKRSAPPRGTLLGGVSPQHVLPTPPNAQRSIPPASSPYSPNIIAIGVSTGGPNALTEILPSLPADFPIPILIVQHMPPMFTKLLAQRLDAKCQIAVEEATPGAILQPGTAWVAPGDFHMLIEPVGNKIQIVINQAPPENSCRPAVDVLLRSVAQVYGNKSLAIILTGMGQDGLRGCEYIHEAGGQIIAQDEASSVVWGMPGFVVKAGLAQKVVSLSQMAGEILQLVSHN